MKAIISIEQTGLYYSKDWGIRIYIECQTNDELEKIIFRLKEITKTLKDDKEVK